MWFELGPLPRIKSTYDGAINPGAKSADLLKHFDDYSRGILPLAPQSLLKLTVYGSARQDWDDMFLMHMYHMYLGIWVSHILFLREVLVQGTGFLHGGHVQTP